MTPEIRAFETALGLDSAAMSHSIANSAAIAHRLDRRKAAVDWDPLALLAADYALFAAIGTWFGKRTVRSVAQTRHFFFYLCMLGVLFLIAAARLPDDPARESDLRGVYFSNRRYFWQRAARLQLGHRGFGVSFVDGILARTTRPLVAMYACQISALFAIPLAFAGATGHLATRP